MSTIVGAIATGHVEHWLHSNQLNGTEKNYVIQKHLIDTGLITNCVRMFELQDIQREGVEFFRLYFAGEKVFGRKITEGSYRIPFLFEGNEGNVLLGWAPFDSFLFSDSPALRVFE